MFSAVSSTFIIDIRSELEPDPEEMAAAYMQILIHTTNNSLFPGADPNTATWTGPSIRIITVQSLLYTSFAISIFAHSSRCLVNSGSTGTSGVVVVLLHSGVKTDSGPKLNGLEGHSFLVIESLPAMIQLALLLLGYALSWYLWTIDHTIAFTLVMLSSLS